MFGKIPTFAICPNRDRIGLQQEKIIDESDKYEP